MATKTQGFIDDKLRATTQYCLGTQFLNLVVKASFSLHDYQYKYRDFRFKHEHPEDATFGGGLLRCLQLGTGAPN